MENVKGENSKFYGKDVFARHVAFFLDADLMRNIFLHPVVILNAKLWHLEVDNLKKINSARLFIANVDGNMNYIDLVNDAAVDEYVNKLVLHYSNRPCENSVRARARAAAYAGRGSFAAVAGWNRLCRPQR